MRLWTATILIAAALSATAGALAQSSLPSVDMELRDNTLTRARLRNSSLLLGSQLDREYRLEGYFLRQGSGVQPGSYLTQTPDRIYGLTRY